ncbi:Na/Pi cotransporter family protein [Phreatobacter sp.]|uniref:Na/Pi cotransporter family protein n=1 Tax=Phreatobacter sp. TaxID=1966341 RepID=UPI003F7107DD
MMVALTVLGGVGLFLLGMSLMTDGLKIAAGTALRDILAAGTRTRLRGLASGIVLTGIVQSSSAVTVAAIGFVNAGLMTLAQAAWVIFGTNVGTTMTGWLVAVIGIKFDVGALSLPFIGLGMLVSLFGRARPRIAGTGQALAGFGAFFLGVGVLRDAFAGLVPAIAGLQLGETGFLGTVAFLGMGMLLTVLTQSSSAALAVALTASAGGGLPLHLAAVFIVGANVGTTSTALVVASGATPAAKRVAAAHIAFNLVTGVVALLFLSLLVPLAANLARMLDPAAGDVMTLTIFHTLFNLLGVVLMWPLAPSLMPRLERMFVSIEEEIGRPRHLDMTLVETPVLAARALILELERMMAMSFDLARQSILAGAGHRPDRAREHGVLRLGRAIRSFITRLQRTPLGGDAIATLIDVIRAIQHLEEMAVEASRVAEDAVPVRPPEWHSLYQAVAAALTMPAADEPDDVSRLDTLGQEVEGAYERLKSHLLNAAAAGRDSLEATEAALQRARRVRRIAQSALKADRRIGRWRPDPATPSLQAGEP